MRHKAVHRAGESGLTRLCFGPNEKINMVERSQERWSANHKSTEDFNIWTKKIQSPSCGKSERSESNCARVFSSSLD